MTKAIQHSPLNWSEIRQKKKGTKQSKVSLIFICGGPAAGQYWWWNERQALTSSPPLLPLAKLLFAASSKSLISLKQLATGGSIDPSFCSSNKQHRRGRGPAVLAAHVLAPMWGALIKTSLPVCSHCFAFVLSTPIFSSLTCLMWTGRIWNGVYI